MYNKIFATIFLALIVLAGSTTFGQTGRKSKNVTINLTESGYRPASFTLKKGIRTRLVFIRRTDRTCGQQLVIPAYGVNRELPLNQPVVVTITPRKTGTFSFTCGMNMLRGRIIVR
jgi:plastocyanin domain-containing protein